MTKTIRGTDDDDQLNGSPGSDTILGFLGDDDIAGGKGNDTLVGDNLFFQPMTLVDQTIRGALADGDSFNARFSVDGTKIVFESMADNLAPDSVQPVSNIFVKDLVDQSFTLVSSDGEGEAANGNSYHASMSADGTTVVFESDADNLVFDDSNIQRDVFVKNITSGAITVISLSNTGSGETADGDSYGASFSPDGKAVLFTSNADDIVSGDNNGANDIFLKTTGSGQARLISTDSDGNQADFSSSGAVFSADGTKVGFQSDATNLVTGDSNGKSDVFLKNLISDETILVSSDRHGQIGNGASSDISLSRNGRYALFTSSATNLVAHDTNGVADVFLKDLSSGQVRLVSSNANGVQGDDSSSNAVFSPDGTLVAFVSFADNLLAGDNNGASDIFVKNLLTGAITQISLAGFGANSDESSQTVSFSPDGRNVIFQSIADNLTPGIANGASNIFVAAIDASPQPGGSDTIDGGAGNDRIVAGGGESTITGGDGNDSIYMNGTLDAGDRIDGGNGSDTLVLNGGNFEPITFAATTMAGIETMLLLGNHSYNLITNDANVAANTLFIVDGSAQDASHVVSFDGSAETDGNFLIIGGAGNDVLKGGGRSNTFDLTAGGNDTATLGMSNALSPLNVFKMGASLTAADTLTSAGFGVNVVDLNGDYSAGLVLAATTIQGINEIKLAANHSYNLTLNAANTNNVSLLTIFAATLGATEHVVFNGAAVFGNLAIIGGAGNDTLTGGGGNDQITGGLGTNHLAGGGGNDTIDMTKGVDTVDAGSGDDTILCAGFTTGKTVDGGSGSDSLTVTSLAGAGGITLNLSTALINNIETLNLTGAGAFNFKTSDGEVAAGVTLTVDATLATTGVKFVGSAETNGMFDIIGSIANDVVAGGAGNDTFDLTLGGSDNATGNGGNDTFLVGNAGAIISGGAGNDTIRMVGELGLSGLNLDGGSGTNILEFANTFGFNPPETLIAANLKNIAEVLITGAANLQTLDSTVAAGATLVIDATDGLDFHFDGSKEKDGHFLITEGDVSVITLGQGSDTVLRTATSSGETINGLGGNDVIQMSSFSKASGGTGNDTFQFASLDDGYNTFNDGHLSATVLTDFDFSADKIDVWFGVTGTNAMVTIATIPTGPNGDAGNAVENGMDAAHLGAHHAGLLKVTDTGQLYVVVDVNGQAGFQFGHDFMVEVTGASHLASFSSADFI